MYHFLGPALGAAIIIFLNSFVTSYFEYWSLILGLILATLLFFFPDGILGVTARIIGRAKRGTS
jgi:ABC-type branched-subunit amino acid transport system permease subunit